eukprot:TRINITY_DN8157_c0_g1_i8.p1 TRINITY_DN8157_c0_g1~~TRINITY_DN8157_c0_g1_i8.p1  ORF type:complete len:376 (+),score=72.11 TRINITY_DN8157_c0_g1_i8:102-1229(+)
MGGTPSIFQRNKVRDSISPGTEGSEHNSAPADALSMMIRREQNAERRLREQRSQSIEAARRLSHQLKGAPSGTVRRGFFGTGTGTGELARVAESPNPNHNDDNHHHNHHNHHNHHQHNQSATPTKAIKSHHTTKANAESQIIAGSDLHGGLGSMVAAAVLSFGFLPRQLLSASSAAHSSSRSIFTLTEENLKRLDELYAARIRSGDEDDADTYCRKRCLMLEYVNTPTDPDPIVWDEPADLPHSIDPSHHTELDNTVHRSGGDHHAGSVLVDQHVSRVPLSTAASVLRMHVPSPLRTFSISSVSSTTPVQLRKFESQSKTSHVDTASARKPSLPPLQGSPSSHSHRNILPPLKDGPSRSSTPELMMSDYPTRPFT